MKNIRLNINLVTYIFFPACERAPLMGRLMASPDSFAESWYS
jgi:hypothetical protein